VQSYLIHYAYVETLQGIEDDNGGTNSNSNNNADNDCVSANDNNN